MMLDLIGPSPDGVDLEWPHPYSGAQPDANPSHGSPLYPYVYASNNPIRYIDPSGLMDSKRNCNELSLVNTAIKNDRFSPIDSYGLPPAVLGLVADNKCEGSCIFGRDVKIIKCEITQITPEKGSDTLCQAITSALICGELTKQFDAGNKANKGNVWHINKCKGDCICDAYTLKKGKQTIKLKDRTIKSTGAVSLPIIGKVTLTCVLTVSGTIEVDGDGFALVDCVKPPPKDKKP